MDNFELEKQVVMLTQRVNELEKQVALLSKAEVQKDSSTLLEDDLIKDSVIISDNAVTEEWITAESMNQENVTDNTPKGKTVAQILAESIENNSKEAAVNIPKVPQNTAYQSNVARNNTEKITAKNNAEGNRRKDMEKTIGNNVMGIAASALIFISLILFGGLIYTSLNDYFKAALMFAVSGIFTAVGLLKMNKESRYYSLFASFAGCGTGAFYISFMICYFGFELYSDMILMVLMIIWTVFVAMLSKYKSRMFLYICYIGIIISTILCAVKWSDGIISLIFYFICVGMLYFLNRTKEYRKDYFFVLQLALVGMIIPMADADMSVIIFHAIFVYALTMLYNYYNKPDKNDEIIFNISVVALLIYTIKLYVALSLCDGAQPNITAGLMLAVFTGLVIDGYVRYKQGFLSTFCIMYYYSMFMAFISCIILINYPLLWENYIGLLMLIVPLYIAGHVLDNGHFKYMSYIYMFIYVMFNITELENWQVILIGFIMLAVIVVINNLKYDRATKYIMSIYFIVLMICSFDEQIISFSVMYVVFSVFSIFMNSKYYKYDKNLKITESISEGAGYIFNVILMLVGLAWINVGHDNIVIFNYKLDSQVAAAVLVIVATIAIYLINTKRLFNLKIKELYVGIYICFKFTVLTYAILSRLNTATYIISVVGLVISITCIILGFKFLHKSFRLYGLVLAMICVAKLVIVDITYSSTLMRPVGFFVAGILCFIISWIYNKLEKKI